MIITMTIRLVQISTMWLVKLMRAMSTFTVRLPSVQISLLRTLQICRLLKQAFAQLVVPVPVAAGHRFDAPGIVIHPENQIGIGHGL